MKVCLYLRYSSNNQTEQSIEGQDRVCTEFCKKKGYEIIHKYIDRAQSAYKNAGARIEFGQMMDDAEKAEWDAIIVYKLDRFARNRTDSAIYKSRLRKIGKQVISATEPISSDPEGILLESVLEGMAEFYSAELAQKVTRGLRESAMKMQSTGGRIPFGYKTENKQFVIDPITAPIVKEIYERYTSGERDVVIRNSLNSRGIPTGSGGKWGRTSLQKILTNPKYKGDYHFMDITNEGVFPAIIDEETWEKAQVIKRTRQHNNLREKTVIEYPLKGYVHCGHCGKTLFADMATSRNGEKHGYYSCYNHRTGDHSCPLQSIPNALLEDKITQEVRKFFTDENLHLVAKSLNEYAQKMNEKNTSLESLRHQLADATSKQQNLYKAIEDGLYTPTIRQKVHEVEAEIGRLRKDIKEQELYEIVLSEDVCYAFLKDFTGARFEQKKILQTFVKSVVVTSIDKDTWDVSVEYAFGSNTPWKDGGSEKFSLVIQDGQNPNILIGNRGSIIARYILKKPAHGEQASSLVRENIDPTAVERLKAILPYHKFQILR